MFSREMTDYGNPDEQPIDAEAGARRDMFYAEPPRFNPPEEDPLEYENIFD